MGAEADRKSFHATSRLNSPPTAPARCIEIDRCGVDNLAVVRVDEWFNCRIANRLRCRSSLGFSWGILFVMFRFVARWVLATYLIGTSVTPATTTSPVKSSPSADDFVARYADRVDFQFDLPYAANNHPRQCVDLYLPKHRTSDRLLPVVVFIHGGGWRAGDRRRDVSQAAHLVSSGEFAAAAVGYRLTDEAIWPAQIHDCKAAVRWIRGNADRLRLDPNKIGAIGESAVGQLASLLATSGQVAALDGTLGPHSNQPSNIACAVNICGPQDFSLRLYRGTNSIPTDSVVDRLLGGTPGYGVGLNKPTVLSNGDRLRPVDSFDPSDGERTRYFVSRDQGRSFAPLAQFPIRDVQFSEHMAIERRDGSLLTLARASYGIAQARSHDGGKTWADDRPFVSNKGVNTRFFVRRLASGSWLLVLNDDPKSRANLTALLSENEGQTWPHKLVLDERRTVSYPDGVEGTDGFVYVAYDRGRYSKDEQEILFAKFTEADVRAGKLVDSSSRLKQTINRLADFGGGVHETREPQLMREALEKPPAAP
jgi:hypothetical protein